MRWYVNSELAEEGGKEVDGGKVGSLLPRGWCGVSREWDWLQGRSLTACGAQAADGGTRAGGRKNCGPASGVLTCSSSSDSLGCGTHPGLEDSSRSRLQLSLSLGHQQEAECELSAPQGERHAGSCTLVTALLWLRALPVFVFVCASSRG